MKWAYIFEVPLVLISAFDNCISLPTKAICFGEGMPQYTHPDVKIHLNQETTLAKVIEMFYGVGAVERVEIIDSLFNEYCE